MSTPLSFVELFLAELTTLGFASDREVWFHGRIDSTSDDLIRRLRSGAPAGTVVAAACQEAGRGRKGRIWHSPEGANLYVSLAIEVSEPTDGFLPLLPLAAGVATSDVIRKNAPVEPRLKWPNDIIVSGKKLAGILCELPEPASRPVIAVVGLGVNITVSSFPLELSDIATSLSSLIDGEPQNLPHPALLAAQWVGELEKWMQRIQSGRKNELPDAWRARAEPFGRRVRVGKIEGTTVDLSEDGRLLVLQDSGEQVVVAGGIIEYIK
ncbi:MAG: biotin--[acetyl-CoA-carboxylase] ligase [Proteobacteria bacterium]|nr:biotin--[acetyl-CoA-carboxylase] ligase [Pseudomonadota bacterium]